MVLVCRVRKHLMTLHTIGSGRAFHSRWEHTFLNGLWDGGIITARQREKRNLPIRSSFGCAHSDFEEGRVTSICV